MIIQSGRCNGKIQLTVGTIVDQLLATNDVELFCLEDHADRLLGVVWLALSHAGATISVDKKSRTIDTTDGAHFSISTPRPTSPTGSPMEAVKGFDLSQAEGWFDEFTHVNLKEGEGE